MAPAARLMLAAKKPAPGRPKRIPKADPDYVPSAAALRAVKPRKRTRGILSTSKRRLSADADDDLNSFSTSAPASAPGAAVTITTVNTINNYPAPNGNGKRTRSQSGDPVLLSKKRRLLSRQPNPNSSNTSLSSTTLAPFPPPKLHTTTTCISRKMATYRLPPRKRHERPHDDAHRAAVEEIHLCENE